MTQKFLQDIQIYNKFHIELNDLTNKGDQDQAIKTLSNVFEESEKYKDFTITLIQPTDEGLRAIFDPNIQILNVNKSLALDEVKKNLPESCKIDLECVVGDQTERSTGLGAKEAFEIITKKEGEEFRFNILLKNANETSRLLEEETKNGTILTFEFANLKSATAKSKLSHLQFNHLKLELFGVKAEVSNALLERVRCVQLRAKKNEIETVSIEIAKRRVAEMRDKKIWIKIGHLDKETANQIIDACPTAKFKITLICVERPETLRDLEGEFVNIILSEPSSNFAVKLIPILRKASLDFTLGFQNLSLERLKDVINKASFQQEDIEITKVKKISEIWMKNVRPNTELAEFAGRGIEYMLEINKKEYIPWCSLATIVVLGGLEIASGILFVISGVFASSGFGLIVEGAFDWLNAGKIWRKRRFSWSKYLTQKALSIIISLCSFGLGKLIDGGFKGAWSAIYKRFNRKALEKAWNLIVKASRELNQRAILQVFVTISRVFAREGLNNLADLIVDLPFERFKPEISCFIQKKVEAKFCNDDNFKILIGKMYALDKMNNSKYFAKQINNIISKIISPENENLTGFWHSFVSPLLKGILSDVKVIGNLFKWVKRSRSILNGLKQIHLIIDSIHNQFIRKLSEIDKELLSIHDLLDKHKKIPLEEAKEISQILKNNDILQIHKSEICNQTIVEYSKRVARDHFVADFEAGYFAYSNLKASPQEIKCELINPQKFPTFPDQEQNTKLPKVLREINFGNNERHKEAVESFCKDLNEFTQNPNSDDLNAIIEIISEKITEQIIRVIESHLISPWSTLGIKAFTKKATAFAEKNWVRDESKEISKDSRLLEASTAELDQEQRSNEDLLEYGVKKEINTENYLSNNHQFAS